MMKRMRFWCPAAFLKSDDTMSRLNNARDPSDAYVMPSVTILTAINPKHLDKSLKYMVSPAGFEPATY